MRHLTTRYGLDICSGAGWVHPFHATFKFLSACLETDARVYPKAFRETRSMHTHGTIGRVSIEVGITATALGKNIPVEVPYSELSTWLEF